MVRSSLSLKQMDTIHIGRPEVTIVLIIAPNSSRGIYPDPLTYRLLFDSERTI